ncbi:meprin A subunit beta-like [Engraulis encrasicolus]|uniref:meprin A subunit beta-like n=1 Tax=Engraulis encrasicolus TaxID=184585 RepID=UPI002FCF4CA7
MGEGDIAEDDQRSSIVRDSQWDSSVPYELDAGLDMNAKGIILRAFEQFRLKTCIDFKPRRSESHYISVEKQNGCWSYVGKNGMKQTLSIGKDCDHISFVEHEFLHALGFLHEQSRYDREDYMSINWKNVVPGMAYNFERYGEAISSTLGTPYDYWSIMHYGQDAFSDKTGPTIRTNDASFQDVIGKRLEMSFYDVEEVNRLYKCEESVSFLEHCSFEDEGMCGMSSCGWKRVSRAEMTTHTWALASRVRSRINCSFVHFSNLGEEAALLTSRRMMPRRSCHVQCLQFFYHHHGDETAQLNVWIREFDSVTDAGTQRLMGRISGSPVDYWQLYHVALNASKTFQVEFEGLRGSGSSRGGFSVDDINLSETTCPHHTWQIRNFSKTLKNSAQTPFLYSPKYYSIDGYRFQIMLKMTKDHFGAFVRLVSGSNDDKLQWPCPWRQVTIEALDQNSHLQHRMSAQISMTTDPTQMGQNGTVAR